METIRVKATVDYGRFGVQQVWPALVSEDGIFLTISAGKYLLGHWLDPEKLEDSRTPDADKWYYELLVAFEAIPLNRSRTSQAPALPN